MPAITGCVASVVTSTIDPRRKNSSGLRPDDDVPDREPELLNRERARVAQTDDRAAAADELLEPLQIAGSQLIRVLRPDRAATAAAA